MVGVVSIKSASFNRQDISSAHSGNFLFLPILIILKCQKVFFSVKHSLIGVICLKYNILFYANEGSEGQ